MDQSCSVLLDRALAEFSVAIFGIVNLDGDFGEVEAVAEEHLSQGADFLDLRTSRRSERPLGDEVLFSKAEHLASRYSGRLCMLGDVALAPEHRALNLVSMVRRTQGNEASGGALIDLPDEALVGWSCSSEEASFSDGLRQLKDLRRDLQHRYLHLSIPRLEEERGSRPEGILATQVALAVIEGATLLSVHEVRPAVKARDEIVKIQHAC